MSPETPAELPIATAANADQGGGAARPVALARAGAGRAQTGDVVDAERPRGPRHLPLPPPLPLGVPLAALRSRWRLVAFRLLKGPMPVAQSEFQQH